MTGIALSFRTDSEGEPKVFVNLAYNGFQGETDWWGGPLDFAEFAEALSTYPIPPKMPIKGEWLGCLRIQIEPVDQIGGLEVAAFVAHNLEGRNRCEAVFHCHYSDMDRFRNELLACIRAELGEATLSPS